MRRQHAWLVALLALATSACAGLNPREQARVETLVQQARSDELTCQRADACARYSPLREMALDALGPEAPTDLPRLPAPDTTMPAPDEPATATVAADAPARETGTPAAAAEAPAGAPRHRALILDYGQDALIARLDLIRGATRSIDVQTYIFDEDDAGHLVLDELLAAARRGVKVRLLIDQLAALRRVDTLVGLAGAHENFEVRLYNPVLGRGRFGYPMYAVATLCCFRRLNQRMHNKLMVVDGVVAITGGRNYQNDYFDWDADYNFRDRDLLVAGPETRAMQAHFDAFWNAPLSTPLAQLSDVGTFVLRNGVTPVIHHEADRPERIARITRDADDAGLVRARLVAATLTVRDLRYIGDPPDKHDADDVPAPSSVLLRDLIEGARERVLLQTPYLVLSKPAQQMFRDLQARADPPRVVVSTNSLAATDAFIPYALSYKYKRRYLRDFKFEIHEFKPFPQDAPIDVEATGTVDIAWREDGTVVLGEPKAQAPRARLRFSGSGGGPASGSSGFGGSASGSRSEDRPTPLAREYSALRYSRSGANERVPLRRGGTRFGLHAKSLVIDDRIGVVGTHNFDPRGDHYNTEAVVVIDDPAFARALAASIERDIAPENAWVIARRDRPPVFSGLEYSLAKLSEHLPVFDLWPVRYATSYEFRPGPECPAPLSPRDPGFRKCYEPVGDFPEVDMLIRPLTRIFTAFGAGLAPIL